MSRDLPDAVLVGRVVRPHGVRGEVVVEPHSDNPQRFARGARLLIEQEGPLRPIEIAAARSHKDRVLVRFEGVSDRDGAEPLRGASLYVDRDAVPPAPEDQYYFFELIGCRCVDRQLGDVGEVVEVYEDGGGLLLEIERSSETGRERLLVPFVKAYVLDVDTEAGVVKTELPEGLLELCVSIS